MLNEMQKAELVELCRSLIKIPSITSNESKIASFIADYLNSCGFKSRINEYNSIFSILKKGNGPVILFDSHIDTVPVEEEKWTHAPFAADVADGKIYGRGAADMKGALAAMMYAGKLLSEDENWNGTFIISGTSWEEFFEGYTLEKVIDELKAEGIKPDYVIIGEASDLNIKRGQRGRTRIHFDVKGRPAHSACPEKGINAVYKATELINAIRNLEPRNDKFLGKGIIELIGIDSLPKPVDSIVPFSCRVSYDLRLVAGDTKESIIKIFEGVIKDLKSKDPDFDAELQIAKGDLVTTSGKKETVEAFPLSWEIEESHPIVAKSKAALEKAGLSPKITKYDFCTNGSYSAGVAKIPTIGFGPGLESTAHIIDEFVEIGQLEGCCSGYIAITKTLLGK